MTSYTPPDKIRSVAVIGTGSVGASWAALFLAHDIEVVAFDTSPNAEARAKKFVTNAWPALISIGRAKGQNHLSTKCSLSSSGICSEGCDAIQENVPEDLSLKTQILATLDGAAAPSKMIF